ncbi:MAG: alanyl-tRNA editing protein [Nocardioides sp.]|nr:alanyl-tRNA editing protein [Nocardioides sp.]
MGVPGSFADRAPTGLADTELFAVDAYRTTFDARVLEVDREGGCLRLDRTAFYPTGGGQPHDTGMLTGPDGALEVTGVRREGGLIWHTVASTGSTGAGGGLTDGAELPDVGTELAGEIDWSRRFSLMRTHTALHILCGVIWADYGIPVTGGNMEPLKGRLDFPFPAMSADLGAQVERRINDEIERAHEIVVDFLPRNIADADPAMIRTAANLIPASIDPLRIIDIVGLDRQADGGTHVLSTAEVGRVRVTGTESKGKDNKRIRLEVVDPEPA